jgi:mono/diheme cytochrome c family protein
MMRVVFLTMMVIGCGSPRRGIPLAGPMALNDTQAKGQLLFMRHCNQCHPNGEGGLGPSMNNKPIPRAVMKLQIRKGVLGSMPAFHEGDLSDGDVEAVLDYVEALRKHK